VDGLYATKSEGVGLVVHAISFQDFQPMWISANVTAGQTDRRTIHCGIAALRVASRGKTEVDKTTSDNAPYSLNARYF